MFDNASDEVKNGQFKSYIDREIQADDARAELEKKSAEALAKTSEGAMFVDFSAEYDGKTQKLSDFVGKGKYVLVDCGTPMGTIVNGMKTTRHILRQGDAISIGNSVLVFNTK